MPEKKFISRERFRTFEKKIKGFGFKKMTARELNIEGKSNQQQPPRREKNRYNHRANQYRYEHNGYQIKLLTSYVDQFKYSEMNNQDSG